MDTNAVLLDAYGRIQEVVHAAVDGLTTDELCFRPDPDANSIGWLVWHLTRVQDDHIAEVAGTEQAWTADGFYDRFGLPFGPEATGYGQQSAEVDAVRVDDPHLFVDYHDAVHARSRAFLSGLSAADLDRIVDTRWDPPVTLGVRLVSVIGDNHQHAGQAAYLRGMILRHR
jgi:uncharacterized damage-inducible protein DinB